MTVILPATLTLANVAETAQALLAAASSAEPLRVDPSALTEIDLAGLQVLCAAHRTVTRKGQKEPLFIGEPGPVIDQAIAELGFAGAPTCAPDCFCAKSRGSSRG